MKMRKAFTLAELMVVIGILALLMVVLIPSITGAYRVAQMNSEKADMQAIAQALEAYKSDFGDYPRNPNLASWNSLSPIVGGVTTPPIYLSLATALIGPNPAVTQNITPTGVTQPVVVAGDGADGPGFRTRAEVSSGTLSAPLSSGINIISVTPVPSSWTSVPLNLRMLGGLSTITIGVGKPNEETLGIDFSSLPTVGSVTTFTKTAFIHGVNETCALRTVTGKVWPAYLPAEKFNIKYVVDPNYPYWPAQPTLMDRWGTAIQYFPRYGPVSNRSADSVSFHSAFPARIAQITSGPLFGNSTTYWVDNLNGDAAMWDARDASDPAFASPTPTYDPALAVRWMLGDDSKTNAATPFLNNVIDTLPTPMTLRYSGNYILLSAGPNGTFCNFLDPKTGKPFPQPTWQAKFKDSRNIYNFDR